MLVQSTALQRSAGQGRAVRRQTEQNWAWSGQTVKQGELCNEFLNLNIKHVDVAVSVLPAASQSQSQSLPSSASLSMPAMPPFIIFH